MADHCLYSIQYTLNSYSARGAYTCKLLDTMQYNIYVSSNGHLLMVSNNSSSFLRIYGSNAELVRFTRLPRYVKELFHAVKTSIRHFIILNRIQKQRKGRECIKWCRYMNIRWGVPVCKVTSDGHLFSDGHLSF